MHEKHETKNGKVVMTPMSGNVISYSAEFYRDGDGDLNLLLDEGLDTELSLLLWNP